MCLQPSEASRKARPGKRSDDPGSLALAWDEETHRMHVARTSGRGRGRGGRDVKLAQFFRNTEGLLTNRQNTAMYNNENDIIITLSASLLLRRANY